MRIVRGRAPIPRTEHQRDRVAVDVANIVALWLCVGAPVWVLWQTGRMTSTAWLFVGGFLAVSTALIITHHYRRQ